MTITIYHNPDCGTSRNTLAMIRQSGEEPIIIEYLRTPPDRATVVRLLADAGLTVRGGTPAEGHALRGARPRRRGVSDAALLDAIEVHPILLNRPFVVTPKGTRLCRPSEVVLDVLPTPDILPFTKEDGEVVAAR